MRKARHWITLTTQSPNCFYCWRPRMEISWVLKRRVKIGGKERKKEKLYSPNKQILGIEKNMPLLLLILTFKNISALDVLNWANMITNSSSSNEFQSVIIVWLSHYQGEILDYKFVSGPLRCFSDSCVFPCRATYWKECLLIFTWYNTSL